MLVTEVEDLNQIAKFVSGMAQRNHWPPERTTALMAHMRHEHLDLEEVGNRATKVGVKSVVLDHYNPGSGSLGRSCQEEFLRPGVRSCRLGSILPRRE